MTFNPVSALNIVECKTLISNKKPYALDLGSQTPSINKFFLENLISNNKFVDDAQRIKFESLKENTDFSTRDFFLSVGYSDYNSIDLNGAYNSYQFDLNKNICEFYKFKENYDLVINNGTGEHVFNQYSLFLNIHNLTKTNGLMLNILPFIDWINHGFYNYNPIFFADLAASNDYEIIKLSLANRNGAEITLSNKDLNILLEQIKPNSKMSKFKELLKFASEKLGPTILIFYLQKKIAEKVFNMPLQGKYLSDVKSIETDYAKQGEGSSKAANQISDNNKRGK